MTTPSTERKAGPLLGTGAQTSWPFTFKVFAATDIAVTIADSLGVETALTYGVDYTVSLNANQETSPGGTVTYPISGSPLPTGSRLVIVGNLPYDQPLDLPAGGNFSPLALENELDRLTMQIQQLRERVGRAIQVSVTTGANVGLPAPSANELIGWDSTGQNLQNFDLQELATAVAYATMRYDTFTGDGVETQFTLTADPVTLANLDVAISGVTQVPGTDYSLLNGVLVFASAPANGTQILARYGEGLVNVGGDSSDIRFLQAGAGAVDRTVQAKLREFVSVKDFGAVGNGIANDTVAIQNAIDSLAATGGVVYFPPGEYRIARNVGVNDRWGVKVTSSNVTLKGDQASLRRFNTDISTLSLAYPLVFVGTPDSNSAAQTQNVYVDGLTFVGENTRHNTPGNALTDFRTAIVFKNTKNTAAINCSFVNVDSSAICYQQIAAYDYANATYYNTTKNYQSKITGCRFIAEPHAVPGRALLHCINADGIDGLVIDGNYFEWTDVCLSGESTYDTADQSENDTFTYASPASRTALGVVKRQTRDIVFSNNNCYNCSEHPLYPAMVSVVISGNNITTDQPNICNTVPIQLRCRGVSVTGNTVIGYTAFVNISEPSSQVTISGNAFYATNTVDKEGGAIAIQSVGLTSYISGRSPYLTYIPMGDVAITGNVIVGPGSLTPTGPLYQNGFRMYTGPADLVNFPDGKIFNINISGNTFKHWQNFLYFIDGQYSNMVVNGNTFTAKPFVLSGFNGATAMSTRAVVLVYGSATTEARNMTFTNNNVFGAKYLVASRTGAEPALSLYPPEQFSNNKLDWIQNTKTGDVRGFDALTNFRGNVSVRYLDRTFSSDMLNNALYSGSGASDRKYNMSFDGTNVRFYTDDAGTFITL